MVHEVNSFDNRPKRAVVMMENIHDDCYSFGVAIEFKDSIKFEAGASEITVDGVKIYLTGRCSYIITEDNKTIGYNNGYANEDLNNKFEDIKDYYDCYVREDYDD